MRKIKSFLLMILAVSVLVFAGCTEKEHTNTNEGSVEKATVSEVQQFDINSIPEYDGNPWVEVNDNVPYFKESDFTSTSYESYSDLDDLGRCGTAVANIGKDLMPEEERGSIGMIKPTGWHTVKYAGIDGEYLYNRCHLIGYQLTGENANEKNLITGTRYMNTEGMLAFENMTADYIKETGNHVLYRVTPVFKGDNLLASGVLMEGESVEDDGKGIEFCVYCYNVQPGIEIDYATGESRQISSVEASPSVTTLPQTTAPSVTYIGNQNSHIFHYDWCESVSKMKDKNKVYFSSREEAVNAGYKPCQRCNP